MATNFPFKIGGVSLDGSGSLPALKYQGASYSRQAIDSSSTGRNQHGEMIRDLISQKDKWQLEFVPCTQAEFSALISVLDSASFNFTYPNPKGTGVITKVCYCGDRSAPVFMLGDKKDTNRSVGLWGNFSVNIIEM